jgi:hypothetical protein
MPESEPALARPSNDEDYSINVPVSGAIRNAFWLVQKRYKIPIARIVELAPFLFVLAAEASLERRRAKLAELQERFDGDDDLRRNFLHLPYGIVPNFGADDIVAAEQESIDGRDILASTLPDDIFDTGRVAQSFLEDVDNPFVVYLNEAAAADRGGASIVAFHRSQTVFTVCREDTLELAGGDEDLANDIFNGWVVLHKMPRELLNDDAVDARIAWLRENRIAYVVADADLI